MARKFGKYLHATYGIAVSTLLGLINRAHRDLHHWRSNQQPQYAEAETLPLAHRFMSHMSDAELTSHGDNARPLDLICIYSVCVCLCLSEFQPFVSYLKLTF